ncbi:unnamed protein product [Closterium sp. Naga37s-1]|nr:unnamed protein product [Closterium sp. Naga37s-1]
MNASCDPWPYLFPWRALEPGETLSTDELLATAAFGGANRGALLTPAGATLVEAVAATAEVTASPADVTIADGVTGVTDTLLAADGSRFLQLTSDFSASSSGDGASGSSNDSTNNSSSAFGSPGVTQALCELKPAASPTSNESQQAQQQQQSPRQLSLSFFARASLCAEGEGGAEGEAGRLLRVLLLAVPLNASAAATAGGDAAAGGGAGEGGAGEQVWAEWRVGVPYSSSSSSSASSPSSLVVPPGGVALHLVIRGVQDSNSSSNSTSGTATVTTTSGIATATSSVAASGSESSSIGATSATVAASMGGGGAGEGAGVKAAAVKRVDVASEAGGGAGAGSTAIDLASVMPTRSESERQKWLAGSQVCHRYSWLKACAAHMLNSHSSASSISHCTSTHNPTSRSPPPSLPPHSPSLSLPCSRPLPSQVLLPMALQHPRLTHSPSLPHPLLSPLPPFPPTPHPCHCPAADPSPLKSFSHWPLSSAHPLITAGSARRNSSSLSLTSLSDFNSASLALHPAPFALLAPATPASPCRPFSFSTSFTFRISSPNAAGLGGEGLAFVMLPTPTLGLPGPSLGYGRVLLPPGSTAGADNSSSSSGVSSQQHRSLAVEFDTSKSLKHFSLPSLYHPQQHRSLAVEFDTSASLEFWDRPDHHVGVNLHGSMLSLASAPVHPLGIPALNAGQTLLATIHYNASSSHLTWLGRNDPDAVSPPPPLLVGFTAATGKGAEQAQAHEVLGWDFQVGEAAEDPLPFWAADSFSFPYITPATPLLTRGSTRKRFFAADLSVAADPEEVLQMRVDYNGRSKEMLIRWYQPPVLVGSLNVSLDLCAALTGPSAASGSSSGGGGGNGSGSGSGSSGSSSTTTTTTTTSGSNSSSSSSSSSDSSATDLSSPSFGQLVVGFTSAALPPPPDRLPSPVALSSWTFRFTDTDPCKGSPVLPCGMGACTKARAPWDPSILVPSCKCPLKLPSFQPSHLSGLPSCFPDSFTCRQFPRNPCAPGVCIDDVDGTYSCLCPSPFFPFYFYPKGAARCYQLRLAETRMPTFLSPYGLTCALILNTYGLTQADFFAQNKGFQCRAPIPVDTLVNVTSRAFSQCTSMYTANYGDTCDSLNALFSTQIQPLNPALTCSADGPRPGQVSIGAGGCRWLQVQVGASELGGGECRWVQEKAGTVLTDAAAVTDHQGSPSLYRNGSVFTHSYSLSLPTPPFSSISSFSSPLPPSPRFLHTFISPLSPIFLLSLSPPSPPFASLSPFLLPLPLSPPSLPFSPLSPLSPSLPFSSLPPSQLLCVAFNQTPAELPAAVAGIWRRLSLALLPDESGPLVRCTAAVQPPAGQYDDKGELGCLCAVGGGASGETRSVCHRLPHALLPDESRPLVRLAAAAQPPAGQHDESGESERLFNAVSFSSPSILFLTDG